MRSFLSKTSLFLLFLAPAAFAAPCDSLKNSFVKEIQIPGGKNTPVEVKNALGSKDYLSRRDDLQDQYEVSAGEKRILAKNTDLVEVKRILQKSEDLKKEIAKLNLTAGLENDNLEDEVMTGKLVFDSSELISSGDRFVRIFKNKEDIAAVNVFKNGEEKYLRTKDCKIEFSTFIDHARDGDRFHYLSSAFCNRSKEISEIAKAVPKNYDEYSFRCKEQGGVADGGCHCKNHQAMDPWSETCLSKRKEPMLSAADRYGRLIEETESQVSLSFFVRFKTYCDKYSQFFQKKSNDGPSERRPASH